MSAYGIARYYKDLERYDLYLKYLVEAIESDGICQLKETIALQNLPIFSTKRTKTTASVPPDIFSIPWRMPSFQQPPPYDRDFKHPASDYYKQPAGCRTFPYPNGDWTHLCLHHLNHHSESYDSQHQTENSLKKTDRRLRHRTNSWLNSTSD